MVGDFRCGLNGQSTQEASVVFAFSCKGRCQCDFRKPNAREVIQNRRSREVGYQPQLTGDHEDSVDHCRLPIRAIGSAKLVDEELQVGSDKSKSADSRIYKREQR